MLNECRWIEACSETDTRPNLLTHKADLLDRKLVWLQCTSKMSKIIVLPVKQIFRKTGYLAGESGDRGFAVAVQTNVAIVVRYLWV